MKGLQKTRKSRYSERSRRRTLARQEAVLQTMLEASERRAVELMRTMRAVSQGEKTVVVVSGAPGTGKSTWCHAVSQHFKSVKICSADAFFMKQGVYNFNQRHLNEAHAACQADCTKALECAETEIIVIDNTSLCVNHIQVYADMAEKAGASFRVIVFELPPNMSNVQGALALERNEHGVPPAKRLSMLNTHNTAAIKAHYPHSRVRIMFTPAQLSKSRELVEALPGASRTVVAVNFGCDAEIVVYSFGMVKAESTDDVPEFATDLVEPSQPGVTLAFGLRGPNAGKLEELTPAHQTAVRLEFDAIYTDVSDLGDTVTAASVSKIVVAAGSCLLPFLQDKLQTDGLHYTIGTSGDRPPFDAKLVHTQLLKKGKVNRTVVDTF